MNNYINDTNEKESRKKAIVTFCTLLFIASILVADISSVKLFELSIFGIPFLLPAGTIAFSMSFLAEDVICEVSGRAEAIKVVWMSVILRALSLIYFLSAIGDSQGNFGYLKVPEFWSPENQGHYSFVLSSTIPIYLAGFAAIIVSFINDAYIFNYLRERHKNKNFFWLRNSLSTMISQLINTSIFIIGAFGGELTVTQLLYAIFGQLIFKTTLAIIDTPLAYTMKNYAQGLYYWYAPWKKEFWRG